MRATYPASMGDAGGTKEKFRKETQALDKPLWVDRGLLYESVMGKNLRAPLSFRQVKIVVPDFDYSIAVADEEMRPRVSKFAARLG